MKSFYMIIAVVITLIYFTEKLKTINECYFQLFNGKLKHTRNNLLNYQNALYKMYASNLMLQNVMEVCSSIEYI